uniref:WD_REPEATS_REGION domain-containing protein n=1 Tax=Panagrellus redivivus TaxID=6233 RepID=A0A7E4V2X3_PANRE
MADRELDAEYLAKLEQRLNQLKDPKLNEPKSEQIIKDIAGRKDLQLFNLLTSKDLAFEDNFVDQPIQASWLQKKVAPASVAVNKIEVVPLVKYDHLEAFIASFDEDKPAESESTEVEFAPIPDCNGYSMRAVNSDPNKPPAVLVIDVYGDMHWVNRKFHVELMPLIDEPTGSKRDGTVEVVASDITADVVGRYFSVATCWVVNDDYLVPKYYFAAFFKVEYNGSVKLWHKFTLNNAPTFTRLTISSPTDPDSPYWLIFCHNTRTQAYALDYQKETIEQVEGIGDVFPVLEIETPPGATTRSHCGIMADYRFSVIGLDTGYVVASVCKMNSGEIIAQQTIKFSGPISVLKLIGTNEKDLETNVLVSSTLGPVMLWKLSLSVDEVLKWEAVTELVGSEACDCVMSGTANADFAFIGTYTEQILMYDLRSVLAGPTASVIAEIQVGSPVLAMQYIQQDDTLLVLSYKGFHKFLRRKGRTFETIAASESASHLEIETEACPVVGGDDAEAVSVAVSN